MALLACSMAFVATGMSVSTSLHVTRRTAMPTQLTTRQDLVARARQEMAAAL